MNEAHLLSGCANDSVKSSSTTTELPLLSAFTIFVPVACNVGELYEVM